MVVHQQPSLAVFSQKGHHTGPLVWTAGAEQMEHDQETGEDQRQGTGSG